MKAQPPPQGHNRARRSPPAEINIQTDSRFTPCARAAGARPRALTGAALQRLVLDRVALRKRIQFLFKILCENERGVGIRFADLAESASLNAQYRKKPYATDVLSFSAYVQNRELILLGHEDSHSLGDLCVCVPVCALQAKENRVSLSAELERMIVHGLLHLKGLDHERNAPSERIMVQFEGLLRRELLREHGRPNWAHLVELS